MGKGVGVVGEGGGAADHRQMMVISETVIE
jgi:hypothetical protein